MGATRLEELRAWQAARRFKLATYAVMRASPSAQADVRFKSQLLESAASGEANVAEGFHRFAAGEFAHFLSIARASIGEALSWLQDGVDRGHFTEASVSEASRAANEAMAMITALRTSLIPYTSRKASAQRTKHPGPDTGPRTKDNK